MSGLDDSGFTVKTFSDIVAEINADLLGTISPSLDLQSASLFGQIVGVFAKREASLWQVAQGVYGSEYPDSANGAALDNVSAITGVTRLAATASVVTLTLHLVGTPTVPAGSVVHDPAKPSIKWQTDADVVSSGTGNYTVTAHCQQTGPTTANASTITAIDTPVAGWSTVTNAADATPGTNIESDSALRLRRKLELAATGAATPEAIRADVLAVSGVTQCTVFENVTDTTNVDSMPPHSFEVVVVGGANQDIANAIWKSKPAGIYSQGTTSQTVTDSQGNTQTVRFTRPTARNIYIIVDVTTDPTLFPSDGATQIKNAITAYGSGFLVGQDVIDSALYPVTFGISGVIDITNLFIGFSPSPASSANLTIGSREIAAFDTSRITVNVT